MQPNFEPHNTPPTPQPSGRPNMPPPMPSPLRQDHAMPVGEQHSVDVNNLPKNAGNNLFQSSNPTTNPDYAFLMNQSQPNQTKTKFVLPKGKLGKVVLGLVGILVIVLLFSVISSLTKGSSNVPYLESVLEDQAAILHITNNASNVSNLSTSNQNFISTANLTLNSSASQLESYLAISHTKVNPKSLTLKVSVATDNNLLSAESSGNYDSTLDQILKADLNSYMYDLKLAYSKTSGPQGKALLTSFYNQANLLLVSLAN